MLEENNDIPFKALTYLTGEVFKKKKNYLNFIKKLTVLLRW